MKFILAMILGVCVLTAFSQSDQKAKGIVFEDTNKNGVLDSGEKGVAKVLVSNQKEVVTTNKDGFYELPVDNQTTIFITKPSEYEVPLNELNLPQFYYIHQPDGSPKMKFGGIEKTGDLPESINFPLYKSKANNNFKMLAVADVQVASNEEIDYFREDLIAPILNQEYQFTISLGDLVHDDLSLFDGYNKSMALLGSPIYSIQGNHDVNYDVDETFSSDTYKSLYGPNYYSFDYGKVHFICLENIERFCKEGDMDAYWNCYKGLVGEEQLEWLKNDLNQTPPEKLVVICQHIAFENNEETGERMKVNNRQELFDILQNREKLLVLAGHKHTLQHDYFNKKDGWTGKDELHQIVCSSASGSWWTGPKDNRGIPSTTQVDGVPNGYFIFEFNGNEFIHSYLSAGAINEQMRIESPLGKTEIEENKIVVNVYNSSKHSVVFAEIDGNNKIELKNEIAKDPFIARSFSDSGNEYKSWASPSNSTQLWKGDLPANLSKGLHVLKVTSVDEFKREYISNSIFEIE